MAKKLSHRSPVGYYTYELIVLLVHLPAHSDWHSLVMHWWTTKWPCTCAWWWPKVDRCDNLERLDCIFPVDDHIVRVIQGFQTMKIVACWGWHEDLEKIRFKFYKKKILKKSNRFGVYYRLACQGNWLGYASRVIRKLLSSWWSWWRRISSPLHETVRPVSIWVTLVYKMSCIYVFRGVSQDPRKSPNRSFFGK